MFLSFGCFLVPFYFRKLFFMQKMRAKNAEILYYYKNIQNIIIFLLTNLHFRCIMNNMDFYAR